MGLFAALGGKTVGALDKHAVGSQAVCWRRVLEAPRTGPLHSRFVLCASRPLEHGPGDHREVLEEREEGEREVVVQPRRKFLRGRGGLTTWLPPRRLPYSSSASLKAANPRRRLEDPKLNRSRLLPFSFQQAPRDRPYSTMLPSFWPLFSPPHAAWQLKGGVLSLPLLLLAVPRFRPSLESARLRFVPSPSAPLTIAPESSRFSHATGTSAMGKQQTLARHGSFSPNATFVRALRIFLCVAFSRLAHSLLEHNRRSYVLSSLAALATAGLSISVVAYYYKHKPAVIPSWGSLITDIVLELLAPLILVMQLFVLPRFHGIIGQVRAELLTLFNVFRPSAKSFPLQRCSRLVRRSVI